MIDKNIKNIIFDFGGVILNINPLLTYDYFSKLGVTSLFEGVEISKPDEILLLFEKGLITPQAFRDKIREKINYPVKDHEIDEAWNAMLLDIPEERIRLLKNLKTRYHTYLLSNTNEIHYIEYNRQLKLNYGYNNLTELFHKAYFSFFLQMNKPNKDIYEFVMKENTLIPEETLFIDDSIINIKGAEATGLKTHHLTGKETINDLFSLNN
jgi:glucose-1-phosphatase